MNRIQSVSSLFFTFFKFGCFTFGGGWSIVAQMRRVYVEDKKLITNEELLDFASVGRSLPGTMIGNIAILFGYHMAGVWGGLACLFGMALPPMIILSFITLFYTAFRDNFWVSAAMNGIRCAVVPIIFCAVMPLMKTVGKNMLGISIAVVGFILFVNGVSCIWIVIYGAGCGIAIMLYNKLKGVQS